MLHDLLRRATRRSAFGSLVAWLGRSVEHRVAMAGVAFAVTLVLTIGGASYAAIRASVLAEGRANLHDEAALVGARLLDAVRSAQADVRRLSRSTLLADALSRTSGHADYLQHLLREDELPFAARPGLSLTDAAGRVVASNAASPPDYGARSWWPALVDGAEPHVEVTVDGPPTLVLAYPVAHSETGKPDGALVLEVPLERVLEDSMAGLDPPHVARLWLGGRAVASAGAGPITDGDSPPRELVPIGRAPVAELAVSVEAPHAAAQQPLEMLARLYVIGGIVALLLAALGARWAARLLTARIRALSVAAERVSLEGDATKPFEIEGEDEPAHLARSIQRMLDRLADARASLESRVAERTADLESTQTRLRSILDNMLDGVVTADEQGRIESFNRSAERIFGWTADEVIGRDVSLLMDATHRQAHEMYLQRRVSAGERRLIAAAREVRAVRKDGLVIPVELLVAESRSHGRRVFIAQIRDVSERHKVDRMKNEFVSVVSHELRTPLTSIQGALGLLAGGAGGPLPAEASQLARIALENGARLGRLIDDLLDVQRIESGKLTFAFAHLPLAELLQKAVELNQAFARRLNTEIVLVGEVPDVRVTVDPSRFQQVMSNLLSNGAKFSPAGARVELCAAAEGREHVRVEVRDRGPGIPAAFRPRVFEKFSQADASSARPAEGTGLGLSIARSLVERMGGVIGFTTEEGRGTSFFVELPVRDAARRAPAA